MFVHLSVVCVCMCGWVYTYLCVRCMCGNLQVILCVCVCVCVCACVCVCLCVCVCDWNRSSTLTLNTSVPQGRWHCGGGSDQGGQQLVRVALGLQCTVLLRAYSPPALQCTVLLRAHWLIELISKHCSWLKNVLIKCFVLIITLYESCAYVSRNMAFLCFCVCVFLIIRCWRHVVCIWVRVICVRRGTFCICLGELRGDKKGRTLPVLPCVKLTSLHFRKRSGHDSKGLLVECGYSYWH